MVESQKQKISLELSKKLKKIDELASYCYSCGKCMVVCPTNLLGIFSPKDFIHNLVIRTNLDSFIDENKLFNCLTCDQCTIYCPMSAGIGKEGVDIAEIIQSLREYGYSQGLIENELKITQTHDDLMQCYPVFQSNSTQNTNKIDYLKDDSSLKITDKGEIAYFIGSTSLFDDIFYSWNIRYKDIPRSVIAILNESEIIPVVLNEKSSGHDNFWIGDVDTAKKLAEYNINIYKNAGVKTIIIEDAEAYRMWKFDYPKLVKNFDFKIIHFTEFIIENNILNKLIPKYKINTKVTYHDPCRMGRLGGNIYDPPREILKNISGVELIEMQNIKDDSKCCGVSNFKNCNSDTKRLRENRINEAIETGAEYLITTCPKCITHFSCFINEVDDEGNLQDSKIQVMDLATFIGKITQII
ncbi:MAG: (Fe-S)-binding protein [archaeon]|nr:(Fe-S)-binding protein [archaeon]